MFDVVFAATISLLGIFIIHQLLNFFSTTLTSPKYCDVVGIAANNRTNILNAIYSDGIVGNSAAGVAFVGNSNESREPRGCSSLSDLPISPGDLQPLGDGRTELKAFLRNMQ